MSELLSAIVRAENLLTEGEYQGVERLLEIIRDHAQSAESLLNAQSHSMTEMHLKVKELTERLNYWEKRARSCESELGD
jgi:hypothetical protein